MPLFKTKAILDHATENRYGVLAVNTFNFETIKWTVMAAELEKVPVIVQFYPGYDTFIPQEFVSHMAKSLAKSATVPVAVHLDHSVSYEIAIGGIKNGFPSIMVDGSSLPFEQNVGLTTAVVRVARVFGVDVEAELGHVGMGDNIAAMTNADLFTNPDEAREFTARTDCDILAIAVGNAHGPYAKTPDLDFDRIKAIRSAVSVPLVMHGSSGIPDEQMQEAVRLGISKYNLATEYFRAYYNALQSGIAQGGTDDAHYLTTTRLEEPVLDFLRAKMRLMNPKGATICTM